MFPIGVTTITFTATDECGNVSNCSFKLTVISNCCNVPPILTCPAEYYSCIGSSTNPSATGVASSSKANPTCADAIISYTDLLLIDQACNKMKALFLQIVLAIKI